jgi:hypothetical protein
MAVTLGYCTFGKFLVFPFLLCVVKIPIQFLNIVMAFVLALFGYSSFAFVVTPTFDFSSGVL